MTDITELAQKKELLIANGYETAELLRNLAENEIDSDCFAVTSECESHGKEVDAYLSITEFALQAARYVDELTEELEKTLARIAELEARTTTERREWMARSFSEGYDLGHSRGLNCGRLYKSDDGMRGHRHACLKDHISNSAGEVDCD